MHLGLPAMTEGLSDRQFIWKGTGAKSPKARIYTEFMIVTIYWLQ